MKKIVVSLIVTLSIFSSPLVAQDAAQPDPPLTKQQGQAASESSYHAVAISMVVIGVGLAVAIGLLAGLIHSNSAHSTQAH